MQRECRGISLPCLGRIKHEVGGREREIIFGIERNDLNRVDECVFSHMIEQNLQVGIAGDDERFHPGDLMPIFLAEVEVDQDGLTFDQHVKHALSNAAGAGAGVRHEQIDAIRAGCSDWERPDHFGVIHRIPALVGVEGIGRISRDGRIA